MKFDLTTSATYCAIIGAVVAWFREGPLSGGARGNARAAYQAAETPPRPPRFARRGWRLVLPGANPSGPHGARKARRPGKSACGGRSASALQRAPYPRHLVEAIDLGDGSSAAIRPIGRSDLLLERAFFISLSPETRYQRLMSARKLRPGELRRLTDIDYRRELALAAVATVDGMQHIRGVARYVCFEREPDTAEFAIVIGDRWQGQGLGERLLERLVHAASDAKLRALTGITLSSNRRMIALARKLGFRSRGQAGDATVTELCLEIRNTA